MPVPIGGTECLLLRHTPLVLGQRRMAFREQYILRGKKEEELQSCVLGLVRAFVTGDKTGTGSWVTGCQGRIRHPGSLGPTLSLNQAGGPEMSSNLLNVTELVGANA